MVVVPEAKYVVANVDNWGFVFLRNDLRCPQGAEDITKQKTVPKRRVFL